MPFVYEICTEPLFEELKLPASLKESESLNPIGRRLIHDVAACSALIVHPFIYSDFPDRSLTFYLRGMRFLAWEYVRRSDGPDRVEVAIMAGVDDATCDEVSSLLEGAVAVLREEASCSVPIVLQRQRVPLPRFPRPVREVILKLNRFCEEIEELKFMQEMKEVAIPTVMFNVLRPTEAESLEQYLQEFGWNELSPDARNLMEKVFDRIHQVDRSS